VRLHRLLLYYVALMIGLELPIPLPWFVCQRPVFIFVEDLKMLDRVQFYGIFRLSLNPSYVNM
jgi:hypothetical protein